MDSRTFGKRTTRGPSSHSGTAQPRLNIPITVISLLLDDLAETFEKKFKKRTIVKQYVYSPLVAGRMRIPEIIERLNFQGIDLFLDVLLSIMKIYSNNFILTLLENSRVMSLHAISLIGLLKLMMMFGSLYLKFLQCRLLMILRLPTLCLLQTMSLRIP